MELEWKRREAGVARVEGIALGSVARWRCRCARRSERVKLEGGGANATVGRGGEGMGLQYGDGGLRMSK